MHEPDILTLRRQATDYYHVNAEIFDSSGETVGEYQLTDHVTTWNELFLIFIMPFKMTPVVAGNVQENMFRTLVQRMIDDEILQ